MESVQFVSTSPEQLSKLINEGIKNQIDAFKKELLDNQANDDLLTRDEACKLLKVSETTLWTWTNKGKVKAYSIASRRYYKRSEILDALIEVKQ